VEFSGKNLDQWQDFDMWLFNFIGIPRFSIIPTAIQGCYVVSFYDNCITEDDTGILFSL
jgi:hypothetical protein